MVRVLLGCFYGQGSQGGQLVMDRGELCKSLIDRWFLGNQSVTFWCRYWSRDRSRDHFGLENGLETGLVTLGSVTFWSQNGLETSLVSKKVVRSGLITQ